MKRVIVEEVKHGIWNLRFPCGMLLIFISSLITVQPYVQQIQEMKGAVEGPGWFAAYTYCISARNALLFIPIAVPLAAGADAELELRSRYYMYGLPRAGKKPYLIGKAVCAAVSGGLMSLLAMLLLLMTLFLWVGNIPALDGGGADTAGILSALAAGAVRFFLNGALWAIAGSLAAVKTRNRYLAYAVPFILYYVLTVFQERYYNTLFFLSPRYWVAAVYYGNFFCIPVLLALCILTAFLLMWAVKRRVEHA